MSTVKVLSGGTKGLTLIELLIAISVSLMIAAALYFSLRSAVESWEVTQDQLLLQNVMAQVLEDLSEGLGRNGVRDALEIREGSGTHLSMVMPWTDDTHQVLSGVHSYPLNKHLKPGSFIPIAEALLPGAEEYKVVPVRLLDPGKTENYPQLFLSVNLPEGTQLRFTFHPDAKKDADVVTTFRYDPQEKAVYEETAEGLRKISQNPFGIKLSELLFRFYDNLNQELGVNGSVTAEEVSRITGVEIALTAESKAGRRREAVNFIALRNAPARTGNIDLKEDLEFPIPDSENIRALVVTNLYGVDNKDELVLAAHPEGGAKEWQVKFIFSKLSQLSPAVLESYSIEYPEGNIVFSDQPKMSLESGINLLSLGPGGRFDYDDDGLEDAVLLEGNVLLEVKKMDVEGAVLFVKP